MNEGAFRNVTDAAFRANYRLGALYSLTTAFLLATQEPFSFPAASRLTSVQFVCLTQVIFARIYSPIDAAPEQSP